MAKVKVKKKKAERGKTLPKEEENSVVPVKSGSGILAIILRENKSSTWKWLPFDFEHFQVGKHTYFKEPKGSYISENSILLTVYIEGISIPISHQYIKKKMEERTYIDATGKEQKIKIPVIQNIKFDSEVVDMLLNRNLADEFLKEPPKGVEIMTMIMLLITIVLGIANVGLHFYG